MTATRHNVFLKDRNWMLSVPTASGFRHIKVATLTGCHSQDDAIQVAQSLIERGQV